MFEINFTGIIFRDFLSTVKIAKNSTPFGCLDHNCLKISNRIKYGDYWIKFDIILGLKQNTIQSDESMFTKLVHTVFSIEIKH